MTFAAGLMILLGWLYATAGNPRSGAILKKSLLIFALPILFAPSRLFHFPFGMLAWVACEEGLKAFASTRERNPGDKFWLVGLFGIWELTLDKPIWALVLAHSGESWDRLSILGLVYVTALPVLMHAVTAAVYAFTFERRLWAAFIISWAIHATFNESARSSSGSPFVVIIETTVLALILAALLLWRRSSAVSQSQ